MNVMKLEITRVFVEHDVLCSYALFQIMFLLLN